MQERVEATRRAMEAGPFPTGAPSMYEGTFFADHTYVAVDILPRDVDGSWRLIELKSSKSAKDEHLRDAAIQRYVLERCGVRVSAVDIMHLNDECRYPELGDLLVRTELTDAARAVNVR